MKICYVHCGSTQHGINRYGRKIYSEVQKDSSVEVTEVSLDNSLNLLENLVALRRVLKLLNKADVVHFQFNRDIWNSAFRGYFLWLIIAKFSKSRIFVTIHDIYILKSLTDKVKYLFNSRNKVKHVERENKRKSNNPQVNKKSIFEKIFFSLQIILNNFFLYRTYICLQKNSTIFVCTQEEKKRLESITKNTKNIIVIPHFIEPNECLTDKSTAKSALSLDNSIVLTILGFIHPRKGHELLINTMLLLPKNTMLVFAGGANGPSGIQFLEVLMKLTTKLKLNNQIRVTGYLTDEYLARYISATDIAICPFTDMSASGSVSTWISSNTPIVASQLPQLMEYNEHIEEAILLFESYTPESLHRSIIQALSTKEVQSKKLELLAKSLTLEHVKNRHMLYYKKGM
jgi:glycosyltransferase involved in cell wall biosynthesis